ncbi:TadE/TadG family type IV pilus assembly protein [Sphingomonas sp. LY160]|uniref:TadE/TadG family type IV pilus assembly protein n=1 Tax=Sphingomonas sp. LY160 TaxID=3095342 RepID=UPI002ADEF14E|nr:TadE/TadG family type IV pilus assembly protein [Sphingomonas sp. LY160]MEA1072511.1 TadE/TadG family type IV pilus assembly protein [Sphingomonas sp. LY160]
MIRALVHNRKGASAAEFALVLPLLLLLMFGIIDAARFLWETNRAEKATQVGARVAVVTDAIPGGLVAQRYVGNTAGGTALTQGDLIPRAALGEIRCVSTSGTMSCTCEVSPCPATLTPYVTTGHALMLTRMRNIKPDIAEQNVRVSYRGSGLGYAGDPNGMEIAPLVTVELTGVQFKPVTALLLATITLPNFRTTLTAEDSAGIQSN